MTCIYFKHIGSKGSGNHYHKCKNLLNVTHRCGCDADDSQGNIWSNCPISLPDLGDLKTMLKKKAKPNFHKFQQ